MENKFAAGMRVVVRDAEWLVKRVERAKGKGPEGLVVDATGRAVASAAVREHQGAEPQRTVENAVERRRQAWLATQRIQTANRAENHLKIAQKLKIQHNDYYVE